MSAISEKLGSGTMGDKTGEKVYLIVDESSETAALTLLLNTAPAQLGDLVIGDSVVEPHGEMEGAWVGTAPYIEAPQAVGASTFRFNTGGGTQHISTSLGTTAFPNLTAPDYKLAIGVTKDGVEGVDIVVPKYEWSETHTIAAADVTTAYIAILKNLTGRTNDDTWQGYNFDEVLFLGAEGARRDDLDWDITFNFAAAEEQTDTIGDIVDVTKKAWEYLWIRFKDVATATGMVKQPEAAYAEQVYRQGDFDTLNP